MSQELSRMERPSADRFSGKRKLLLVPLLYGPPTGSEEGSAILQRYWEQVQAQISDLESKLGGLRHVYHESLTSGGDEGLKQLEAMDQRSHGLVAAKCQAGAALEATEDREILLEALDLQRCLMVPLMTEKVTLALNEWMTERNRSRYEKIGSQIDETLGENEVGLLLINERHQVQFAEDIEVFFISPPAVADFRTWYQQWAAQEQKAAAAQEPESEEPEPEEQQA